MKKTVPGKVTKVILCHLPNNCAKWDCDKSGCPLYSWKNGDSDKWKRKLHQNVSSLQAENLSSQWGILFVWLYYTPGKRIPGFSLLWIFILFPPAPRCQLRLSVLWNRTGRTGADYSSIFLDLFVVHQIWGWSFYTCLTCPWGHNDFPSSVTSMVQICQCNHASSPS